MINKSIFTFTIIFIVAIAVSAQPKLDGQVTPGEWTNAEAHDLKGCGKVWLLKNKNELYVALTGETNGWAHVYMISHDTVRVLHASAALGDAAYVKRGDTWQPVKSFAYELRDRIHNDVTIGKQNSYYKSNGWVANNNNSGDGKTLEFRIDLARLGTGPSPMAFIFLSDLKHPHHFPLGLTDDTVFEELTRGETPARLKFVKETWFSIE